jgi:hypothetical protein
MNVLSLLLPDKEASVEHNKFLIFFYATFRTVYNMYVSTSVLDPGQNGYFCQNMHNPTGWKRLDEHVG